MKNRFSNILILAFFTAFGISQLSAQDAKTKTKVVVIEKTIDKDGKVEVKKEIKEGSSAEKYLKEVEVEVEVDKMESKDSKDKIKVVSKKHIRIVKKDDDGNEEVYEWNGEGDMPEHMQKLIDEEGFEIEHHEKSDRQVIVKVIDGDGDMAEEIIIENGGTPQLDEDLDLDPNEIESIHVIKAGSSRKATLGVVVQNADSGVEVIEIIEGSAAEKHGLVAGDIITEIDGDQITDVESLVAFVSQKNPEKTIQLVYIHDGEPIAKEIKLDKADDTEMIWKTDDAEEDIIIIRKKK